MSEIKTVIFDMDGVIIDSEPIHMKVEQDVFRELDLNISKEEHQNFVGKSGKEMIGGLIEKYQLDVTAEEVLREIRSRYLKEIKENNSLSPVKGVQETLQYLYSQKELILASSATRTEIEWVFHRFDLDKYFSFSISGAEMERSKPDPAIFNKAAKLSKTSPECCCVIEDSRNGVLAAKAAGMKCIGFRNPNSGNQDLSRADLVIEDFIDTDFYKILDNLI